MDSEAKPRWRPASAISVSPVTWRAAGDAKKIAAPARSSGLEATFKGAAAATAWRRPSTRSGGMPRPNHGVSMKPGQMAFTRILGASALASDKVMVTNAPFEAAYGTDEPSPVTAAMEAVLTTAPG